MLKILLRNAFSVLLGRYKNIEVIVINDGSKDNTETIIKSLAENDDRIHLISQENKGVAAARNNGLKNVTGDYIAWCDADDYVEPTWLKSMYQHLISNDADISICRCVVEQSFGEIKEPVVWSRSDAIDLFLVHSELNGSMVNKLFSRALFADILFDEHLSYFEDDLVFWRILNKTKRIVRFYDQAYVTLLAMFRGNYTDVDSEIALKRIMLKHVNGIQLCKQMKHKVMYMIVCFSTKMARSLL